MSHHSHIIHNSDALQVNNFNLSPAPAVLINPSPHMPSTTSPNQRALHEISPSRVTPSANLQPTHDFDNYDSEEQEYDESYGQEEVDYDQANNHEGTLLNHHDEVDAPMHEQSEDVCSQKENREPIHYVQVEDHEQYSEEEEDIVVERKENINNEQTANSQRTIEQPLVHVENSFSHLHMQVQEQMIVPHLTLHPIPIKQELKDLDFSVKVLELELQGIIERAKEVVYIQLQPPKLDLKSVGIQSEQYILTYDVTCQTPTKSQVNAEVSCLLLKESEVILENEDMKITYPAAIVQQPSSPSLQLLQIPVTPTKCDKEVTVQTESPTHSNKQLVHNTSVFNTEIISEKKSNVSQSCSPIKVLSPVRSQMSSPIKESTPKKEFVSVMT